MERHLNFVLELVTAGDVPPTPFIGIIHGEKVSWNCGVKNTRNVLIESEWRTHEVSIFNVNLKVGITCDGVDHLEDSFCAFEVGCCIFYHWLNPELDGIFRHPILHDRSFEPEVWVLVNQLYRRLPIVAGNSVELLAVNRVSNSVGCIWPVVSIFVENVDESGISI